MKFMGIEFECINMSLIYMESDDISHQVPHLNSVEM